MLVGSRGWVRRLEAKGGGGCDNKSLYWRELICGVSTTIGLYE